MSASPPPIPPDSGPSTGAVPGVTATGGSAAATQGSAAATEGSAAASGGSIANVLNLPRGGVTVRMETRKDEYGSVVDVVTQRPPPVRRPPGPPPSPPIAVYGRAAQLNRVTDAISGSSPIVVAGAAGAGKSTVIAAAANGAEAAAIADGIVLIRTTADGEQHAPDWIAQEIYTAVWDTGDERRYQTAVTARAELAGIHPLVLVDGPRLRLEDFRAVADIVPGSPLVIASQRLPVGGALRFVPLPALPRADSIRLLADLTGADADGAAQALDRAADLLDDWPGALATVGGVVGAGRITLGDAIGLMEGASPGDRTPPARGYVRALAVLDQALTADEQAILDAIAGFAGAPVRDDIASRVAGQASTDAAEALVASTVARHNSPQLTVDGGLLEAIRQEPKRAAVASGPEALARHPEWIAAADAPLDTADVHVALAALDAAWRQENWPSVRALARAIDPVVSSRGMWDVWADVLAKARGAAIRSDVTADVAWADHQLGTRALASGDLESAGEILTEAAEIRDGLGLTDAAARTRHNLETLRALLPPPVPPVPPGRPWVRLFVAGIAVVGVLLLGARIVEAVLTPTPSPSPSVTQPPTDAPTIPPTVGPRLDATFEPRAFDVDRAGAWTGTVLVTPLNGTPPYTFTLGGEATTSEGATPFEIGGQRCEPATLAGTISSADPNQAPFEFSEQFSPGCEGYDAPPPPEPRLPAPGIQYLNCTTVAQAFAWSRTDGAVEWLIEVQQRSGETWTPVETPAALTGPRAEITLPCDHEFQWRVAAVSAADWESAPSPWIEFAIQPTATPVPSAQAGVIRCRDPVVLEWTAEPTDGIKAYFVDVVDSQGNGVYGEIVDGQTVSIDVRPCGDTYRWFVRSMDEDDRRGDPSIDAEFTIGPPSID